MKKIRALCIVAHPDDETIWMGGTILKHKDWDWTILSLCRENDVDRCPKFKKACKRYGAKAIISDLDDENLKPLEISKIVEKIKSNLPRESYDYVFTHGENGEYGHLRHVEIHKAVKRLIETREIKCSKLYCFDYVSGKVVAPHNSKIRIPVAKKDSDWLVKLNKSTQQKKYELVNKVYGFEEGIFETLSCNGEEAFGLVYER